MYPAEFHTGAGAAPDYAATLFSVDVGNGRTIWLGEVGNKEYRAKPAR